MSKSGLVETGDESVPHWCPPLGAQLREMCKTRCCDYTKTCTTRFFSVIRTERIVQIISNPMFGSPELLASPAQFGGQLDFNEKGVSHSHLNRMSTQSHEYLQIEALTAIGSPFRACSQLDNAQEMIGKIAIVERSDCMFQEKARFAQAAGSVGVIVIGMTAFLSFSLIPTIFRSF